MSDKKQPEQLETPTTHSGKKHPKPEAVREAKLDTEAQKTALKNRQATQDHE